MRKLSHSEILRIPPAELDDARRHPFTVIVENVRSAYNVGAMLRSADAAFVEQIITTGYTPPPDSPKVRKTALGAESFVPWDTADDALTVVERLRKAGYTIAVLEITDEPTRVEQLDPPHFPLALVVGNEIAGVTPEVVEQADLALEIPQYGSKQSLNVAVAFGVAALGIVERFRQIRPRRS